MLRRLPPLLATGLGQALTPGALAARRLRAEAWLAAAIGAGMLAAVAFSASIPTYSNAVYVRLLRAELLDKTKNYPPFAFMFHHLGSKHGYPEWQDLRAVDTFLSRQAAADLGLPPLLQVRFFQTVPFEIFPRAADSNAIGHTPLGQMSFAFQSDFARHVSLLEGRLPADRGLFAADSSPRAYEKLVD